MAQDKKPRGYIEKVLFIDAETSGLAYSSDDPSYDSVTNEVFQAVSFGLIVANAQTLEPIEDLYVEIKWNGDSKWDKRAEAVHGLSLGYLEENGMDEEDAVVAIASLILKYWGPESPVCLAGHNVATFDKFFLNRLLKKHGISIRFGSKTIDTNAIGFATFGTHNSDDLFAVVGCPERDPAKHNALTDAHNALTAVRVVRQLFTRCVDGE
jgi:Exonuclease